MRVKVRNNNVERALAIFKKKCNPIILEVRARQYYDKPAEARNKAKRMAEVRERRRQQNDGRVA